MEDRSAQLDRILDSDPAPAPLLVHVIATTDEGTRSALAEAKRLADGLDLRVVLLVPHLVSYAVPLADPAEAPAVIADRYCDIASTAGGDATVRLCFCRRRDDGFRWLLARHSLIVLGGRRRRWWPTTAERMARRLIRNGHEVIFASRILL